VRIGYLRAEDVGDGVAAESQENGVDLGDAGHGPCGGQVDGLFAEALALLEHPDAAVALVDADLALLDDVERVAGVALVDDRLAGLEGQLDQPLRDELLLRAREVLRELQIGDELEVLLGVLVGDLLDVLGEGDAVQRPQQRLLARPYGGRAGRVVEQRQVAEAFVTAVPSPGESSFFSWLLMMTLSLPFSKRKKQEPASSCLNT